MTEKDDTPTDNNGRFTAKDFEVEPMGLVTKSTNLLSPKASRENREADEALAAARQTEPDETTEPADEETGPDDEA